MAQRNVDIVFTCGGTGGHVYPVIGLAQSLSDKRFVFFGSETRQDAQIIPRYGFGFEQLPSSSRNVVTMIRSLLRSYSLLKYYRPKVVVSSGGYFTFPVVLAAKFLGIPVILLEQNVLPGRANRWLSRLADFVCVSFPASKSYFNHGRIVVTGNPIRQRYLDTVLSKSFQKCLPLSGKVLLVFGGSQGAHAINDCVADLYERVKATHDWTIVHITGTSYFQKHYKDLPYVSLKNMYDRESVFIFPYFENMKMLYDVATVVVSRAGATTIAELLAYHVPAVLIPFPFAADNHQEFNAKAFVSQAKGQWFLQSEMTPDLVWSSALRLADFRGKAPSDYSATDKVRKILELFL